MEARRLFIDMDGTLAVFREVDTLETLYEEGYFASLPPQETVVAAVRELRARNPELEIYVLSAVLSDSKYALKEKNEWLDQYLPELDRQHRIFPPCGANKRDYIPAGLNSSDVLFDDYTKNLIDWEPPAKGVKCLNGINHTNGTWQGARVSIARDASQLAEALENVIYRNETILDGKPEQSQSGIKV